MNDAVGDELRRIVAEYGLGVCEDPRRLETLLRDLPGEHRHEIFVLAGAAEEGIPSELLAAKDTVPAPVLGERLARLLEENLDLGYDASRWAVAMWASALDVTGFPSPMPMAGLHGPEPGDRRVAEDVPEPPDLLGEWLARLQPGQPSDLGWGLLEVLAAAAGPLSVPEVADLLGTPVRALHQVIAPAKDLLLAQGKLDLSGPASRAALAGYVGRAERQDGLARLTDWCARWAQTGHRADEVPDYVIAHASTHLRDAGHAETLYGLIGNGWRRLSAARTGSPRGFMLDMKLVSECATSVSPPCRLQDLRATLALTTAATLASRVPPEALGVIVSAGQHRRAMELAGFLTLWEKGDAYGRIALALHRKGLVPEADEAAAQAIIAADQYPGLLQLDHLAESFRDHGPEGWAVRAAERILATLSSQRDDKARQFDYTAGKTAASIFTRVGRLNDALQAAEAITHEIYRDKALTDVSAALARAGRARDAVSATQTMSENGRMHVMRELFRVIGEVADIDGVLAAIDAIDDPEVKDQATLEAAIAVARTGLAEPAMALAGGVAAEWRRAYAAKTIASSLVAAGQVDRAIELVAPAADEEERSEALTNIAEAAAAAGLISRALQVVSLIPGDTERNRATEAVVAVLARSGNVAEATDLARAADSQYRRDLLLAKVAEELAGAGHLHHAVEVTETISDHGTRAQALLRVVDALAKAGHHFRSAALAEQAAAAARAAKSISRQAEALTAWAQALSSSARTEQTVAVAEQAVAAAEAASDPALLAKALATWASALTQSGRTDQATPVAERAIAAARASEYEWDVDRALREVAITLAHSGPVTWAITAAQSVASEPVLADVARELARRGLADNAIEAARALEHSWDREKALSEIAEILARRGQGTQAITAARAIVDTAEEDYRLVAAHDMARAVERAATALAENGQPDDALSAAQAASSQSMTHQILVQVACTIGRAGDPDRAATIAGEITDVSARAGAYGKLAEALADQGRPADAALLAEKAIEVALTRPGNPNEAEALARLAVPLHVAGDTPAAVDLAELGVSLADPDPAAGGNAIVLAAAMFAEAGDSARALSLAQQAAAAARTAAHAEVRAEVLAGAASVLARAGDDELAIEAAKDALAALRADPSTPMYRSDLIAATAIAVLVAAADVEEGLTGLDVIQSGARKAEALSRIAAELAQHGQHDQLLGLARDRRVVDQLSEADRVAALIDIAGALVTAGEPDEATALAQEARSEEGGLSQTEDRTLAIAGLALLLARLGRTEEAIAAAAEVQGLLAQVSGLRRSRTIAITVKALAQAGQTGQALALARDAKDVTQDDRAECLLAAAATLTSAGDQGQAAALVDEAFAAIRDAGSRAGFYRLLCDLLPRHPDLLKVWLPGAGELSRLVQELAGIEAWWRS